MTQFLGATYCTPGFLPSSCLENISVNVVINGPSQCSQLLDRMRKDLERDSDALDFRDL